MRDVLASIKKPRSATGAVQECFGSSHNLKKAILPQSVKELLAMMRACDGGGSKALNLIQVQKRHCDQRLFEGSQRIDSKEWI